jgi:Flp pilus assembly protein TadD
MGTGVDIRRQIRNRVVVAAIVGILAVAGCSTAPVKRSARIEIQEEIGFTITEKARISGKVRADYESALDLLEHGQHEQGIKLLQRVTEEAPELSAPRIDLGIAFHRIGDLESAETHLQKALVLNPDHPIVHNELGIVYRKTGRFAEARSSYEKALAVYPGFHFARRNLAILCDMYLADLPCAIENYQAYLDAVPQDDEATIWIADIRNRAGR